MKACNTDPQTSRLMSRQRHQGTKPELAVAMGMRYRGQCKGLPGRPDVASKTNKWAIFVRGCFWHNPKGCPRAKVPKRNNKWWQTKFWGNAQRDTVKARQLRSLGFAMFVVWECQSSDPSRLRQRLDRWRRSRAMNSPKLLSRV